MPETRRARHAAAQALGARLYRALSGGSIAALFWDDLALRRLLHPEAAVRASSRRLNVGAGLEQPPLQRTVWQTARYAGVCLQDSRNVAPGAPSGLRRRGWVVGRVLVVGRTAAGDRVAGWVEGQFVFTDVGFGALSIERLEGPRREHSDLQLSPCDLRAGLD